MEFSPLSSLICRGPISDHCGGVFCAQIVTILDVSGVPDTNPSLGFTTANQTSSHAVALAGIVTV